jgi:GntR family transcriptional regulator
MYGIAFVISQADPTPMYQQLMDQICQRVIAGDWPAGYEMPSIRVLAASVRVSVITVKRAYLELERQGVIVTRPGRGSCVAAAVDLGLRLRRAELEEHLKAVAALSVLLGISVADITQRLRALRDASIDVDVGIANAGDGNDEEGPQERGRES